MSKNGASTQSSPEKGAQYIPREHLLKCKRQMKSPECIRSKNSIGQKNSSILELPTGNSIYTLRAMNQKQAIKLTVSSYQFPRKGVKFQQLIHSVPQCTNLTYQNIDHATFWIIIFFHVEIVQFTYWIKLNFFAFTRTNFR